jgi:hypothetical protein
MRAWNYRMPQSLYGSAQGNNLKVISRKFETRTKQRSHSEHKASGLNRESKFIVFYLEPFVVDFLSLGESLPYQKISPPEKAGKEPKLTAIHAGMFQADT